MTIDKVNAYQAIVFYISVFPVRLAFISEFSYSGGGRCARHTFSCGKLLSPWCCWCCWCWLIEELTHIDTNTQIESFFLFFRKFSHLTAGQILRTSNRKDETSEEDFITFSLYFLSVRRVLCIVVYCIRFIGIDNEAAVPFVII